MERKAEGRKLSHGAYRRECAKRGLWVREKHQWLDDDFPYFVDQDGALRKLGLPIPVEMDE